MKNSNKRPRSPELSDSEPSGKISKPDLGEFSPPNGSFENFFKELQTSESSNSIVDSTMETSLTNKAFDQQQTSAPNNFWFLDNSEPTDLKFSEEFEGFELEMQETQQLPVRSTKLRASLEILMQFIQDNQNKSFKNFDTARGSFIDYLSEKSLTLPINCYSVPLFRIWIGKLEKMGKINVERDEAVKRNRNADHDIQFRINKLETERDFQKVVSASEKPKNKGLVSIEMMKNSDIVFLVIYVLSRVGQEEFWMDGKRFEGIVYHVVVKKFCEAIQKGNLCRATICSCIHKSIGELMKEKYLSICCEENVVNPYYVDNRRDKVYDITSEGFDSIQAIKEKNWEFYNELEKRCSDFYKNDKIYDGKLQYETINRAVIEFIKENVEKESFGDNEEVYSAFIKSNPTLKEKISKGKLIRKLEHLKKQGIITITKSDQTENKYVSHKVKFSPKEDEFALYESYNKRVLSNLEKIKPSNAARILLPFIETMGTTVRPTVEIEKISEATVIDQEMVDFDWMQEFSQDQEFTDFQATDSTFNEAVDMEKGINSQESALDNLSTDYELDDALDDQTFDLYLSLYLQNEKNQSSSIENREDLRNPKKTGKIEKIQKPSISSTEKFQLSLEILLKFIKDNQNKEFSDLTEVNRAFGDYLRRESITLPKPCSTSGQFKAWIKKLENEESITVIHDENASKDSYRRHAIQIRIRESEKDQVSWENTHEIPKEVQIQKKLMSKEIIANPDLLLIMFYVISNIDQEKFWMAGKKFEEIVYHGIVQNFCMILQKNNLNSKVAFLLINKAIHELVVQGYLSVCVQSITNPYYIKNHRDRIYQITQAGYSRVNTLLKKEESFEIFKQIKRNYLVYYESNEFLTLRERHKNIMRAIMGFIQENQSKEFNTHLDLYNSFVEKNPEMEGLVKEQSLLKWFYKLAHQGIICLEENKEYNKYQKITFFLLIKEDQNDQEADQRRIKFLNESEEKQSSPRIPLPFIENIRQETGIQQISTSVTEPQSQSDDSPQYG